MNEEHTVADRPPVGTELIIISTSGHGFPKGAIVTIDKELSERDIREGIVHAVDSNGYGQYLKPENFEIYIPESPEAIEENPDYKETHLTFDEIYNEIMKGSYHA
jgi:hypothetical protein